MPEMNRWKHHVIIPPPEGWVSWVERRLVICSFQTQFIILISLKNQFTSFPPPHKSSLGSFALLLMVFFITGWSIQLRLIEHEAGIICEAIYQWEGTGAHRSPPAVIIWALVPEASGTPEPQVARVFAERAGSRETAGPRPAPPHPRSTAERPRHRRWSLKTWNAEFTPLSCSILL